MATPIGNLADISLRALATLQIVDAIACEDTRHTQSLLRSYGLERPQQQLIALHQHNELQAAEQVIARLRQGERIAYVSDAGTPGISDPGAKLCAVVSQAGLRCTPLPGASSVISALSVAGCIPHDITQQGFVFHGFLPTKNNERQTNLEALLQESRCTVLLEAPHRITDLLQRLASLSQRTVTVAKEISKQFEQIITLPAPEAYAWLQAEPQRSKGEFVLILHPESRPSSDTQEVERILQLLVQALPTKTAVKLCADITGASRNGLYEKALAMKVNQGA